MENLRKRPLLTFIIIALIAILPIFGKTTIEEYKSEIKRQRETIINMEKENKELSILLQESNSEKDIEIIKNKDGSSVKRIKTKKSSRVSSISEKESKEKIDKKESLKEDIKNEKRITHNPKKLNLSIGVTNNLQPYVDLNYNYWGPITVGGFIEKDARSYGIKVGISF